jgi:hypothetical protein
MSGKSGTVHDLSQVVGAVREPTTRPVVVPPKPYSWVGSIHFVNAAGLRPQDSAFVGLSNFPSFDRNHAGKERGKPTEFMMAGDFRYAGPLNRR